MILLTFSIPLSTPSKTTIAVMPRKRANQRSGSTLDEINEPKNAPPFAAISEPLPVAKPKRYLRTQPPITE